MKKYFKASDDDQKKSEEMAISRITFMACFGTCMGVYF